MINPTLEITLVAGTSLVRVTISLAVEINLVQVITSPVRVITSPVRVRISPISLR